MHGQGCCCCRTEVREQYGVKIYFDPVSTAAREEDAKGSAREVLQDQSRADDIDTVRLLLSLQLLYSQLLHRRGLAASVSRVRACQGRWLC